jgi:hypothetical protein
MGNDRQAMSGGDDVPMRVKAKPALLLNDEAAPVADSHQ